MRALLAARKLIQSKLFDVEMSLRGVLRRLQDQGDEAHATRRHDEAQGRVAFAPPHHVVYWVPRFVGHDEPRRPVMRFCGLDDIIS